MKIVRDISMPIRPEGDPMGQNIGPGAWAERSDTPDLTFHGTPKIVPMSAAEGFSVATEDADPRGMSVVGCDGKIGGTVTEIWVDRSEPQIRYLEVETVMTRRHVLLPMGFAKIKQSTGEVRVHAVAGHHFERVPATANPGLVTLREEDQIAGFYGGGFLYAEPSRQEPMV
jgi:photosynthetic reaction center H subunit